VTSATPCASRAPAALLQPFMAGSRSASPTRLGRTAGREKSPALPPLSANQSLTGSAPALWSKKGTKSKLKMLGRMKRGSVVRVDRVKTAAELAAEWKERQAAAARKFKPRPGGKLTDDQLRIAKLAFNDIDSDGSGTIDMDELLQFFKRCGKAMSREEIAELMADADRSQDNKIDLREFLDFFIQAISPASKREEEIDNFRDVLAAYGEKADPKKEAAKGIKKSELVNLLNEQYDLEVDSSFIDGLMKEAWKKSAKADIQDLEDGLDDILTLDELKQAFFS